MPLEAPVDFKRNRDRSCLRQSGGEPARETEIQRWRKREREREKRVDVQSSNLRKLQIWPAVLRRSHGVLRANVGDLRLRGRKLRSNKATNQPNERHADAGNAA